jgi:hypothetical protein
MKRVMSLLNISLTLLLCCCWSETVSAQAVKIDGEIRTRTELREGMKSPVADSLNGAVVTNMRTRLSLSYAADNLTTKITVQDTRTFGQTAPGSVQTNSTGIYEAWGEYLFAPGMSFKIGRQTLEYDDKRLFSVSNWSNTGLAHDLLLLKYNTDGFALNLGSAWNNSSDVMVESAYTLTYKTMSFLWLTKSIGKVGISAIWVNDGFQKGTTPALIKEIAYRNTAGGNIWLNAPDMPINFYGTGYYQFGHDPKNKQLNAYLLAGKVTGHVMPLLSLTLGEDYYSGSSATLATDKDNTFNKLYGTNHSFNGSMEYWTTPPTQGLSDTYLDVETKPFAGFIADATFHKFSLAKQPKKGNKDLGSELDLTLTYPLSSQVSLQGGYSTYFTTNAVNIAKNITTSSRTPQWAFVMISFKPTFLAAK